VTVRRADEWRSSSACLFSGLMRSRRGIWRSWFFDMAEAREALQLSSRANGDRRLLVYQ
jgi:hypothetical protein